ncbi:MAG: 2TM domain-containing protein [Microcystaceae cyanobacterium]
MIAPNPQSFPTYRQEDAQEIIQLAIAQKMDREELSKEQLWEIAEELDIDAATLVEAEKEWLKQRETLQKRQEFDLYRRDTLKHQLTRFAIVNGFLVTLNLISSGGLSWSLYILLIWGMKATLNIWQTYQQSGEAYEQAFERWNVKNEVKQSINHLWSKVKLFLQGQS